MNIIWEHVCILAIVLVLALALSFIDALVFWEAEREAQEQSEGSFQEKEESDD